MNKKIELLVLDDESIVCERLKEYMMGKGINVEAFTESDKAISRLKEKRFDVVVTDMKMPGPTEMEILRFMKDHQPENQAIIITAYGLMEELREAEALRSYEFITKPFQMSEMHKFIVAASKRARKLQA